MTATKADAGKAPIHLLPAESLLAVAQVMDRGAQKYGERNWEKGLAFSRVYSAMMRHALAWWSGEDLDPETGLSHMHHASACALMLSSYVEGSAAEFDDRPHVKEKA